MDRSICIPLIPCSRQIFIVDVAVFPCHLVQGDTNFFDIISLFHVIGVPVVFIIVVLFILVFVSRTVVKGDSITLKNFFTVIIHFILFLLVIVSIIIILFRIRILLLQAWSHFAKCRLNKLLCISEVVDPIIVVIVWIKNVVKRHLVGVHGTVLVYKHSQLHAVPVRTTHGSNVKIHVVPLNAGFLTLSEVSDPFRDLLVELVPTLLTIIHVVLVHKAFVVVALVAVDILLSELTGNCLAVNLFQSTVFTFAILVLALFLIIVFLSFLTLVVFFTILFILLSFLVVVFVLILLVLLLVFFTLFLLFIAILFITILFITVLVSIPILIIAILVIGVFIGVFISRSIITSHGIIAIRRSLLLAIILVLLTHLTVIVPLVRVIGRNIRQIRGQINNVQIIIRLVVTVVALADVEENVGRGRYDLPSLDVFHEFVIEEVLVFGFDIDALGEFERIRSVNFEVLVV
mmetsp:Transcript_14563/g.31086  ORF Transcript_14563/g.31086 Transcript_14563/m.31086 type:complete len:461 (-) Transcript_14563:307-1689(-)